MALPKPIQITRRVLSSFFSTNIYSTLVEEEYGTYTLSNHYSLGTAINEKGSFVLWELPVKEKLKPIRDKYPIYFSLRIKIKDNDEIDEVNIKIFKEDTKASSQEINLPAELLLRVEWSNKTQSEVEPKHAQPHWHIHSYTVVDKLEGRNPEERRIFSELLEPNGSFENAFSILANMDDEINKPENIILESKINIREIPTFKFHLAMLADWDKSPDLGHNKTLTNEGLEKWLPKCLDYIKEQTEYILSKMGKS